MPSEGGQGSHGSSGSNNYPSGYPTQKPKVSNSGTKSNDKPKVSNSGTQSDDKPKVSNSGTKSNDKKRSKENDSGYWPKSAPKDTGRTTDARFY